MPGRTLLSYAHPLCLGTLSFAEGKIEYPMDLKRSLVFSCASYLLAYCLAEGASPAADRAEGGGGVATLIAGSARPNPWERERDRQAGSRQADGPWGAEQEGWDGWGQWQLSTAETSIDWRSARPVMLDVPSGAIKWFSLSPVSMRHAAAHMRLRWCCTRVTARHARCRKQQHLKVHLSSATWHALLQSTHASAVDSCQCPHPSLLFPVLLIYSVHPCLT